jgi:hypothetical protein
MGVFGQNLRNVFNTRILDGYDNFFRQLFDNQRIYHEYITRSLLLLRAILHKDKQGFWLIISKLTVPSTFTAYTPGAYPSNLCHLATQLFFVSATVIKPSNT